AWLDHLRDPESLIVHNPRPRSGPTNRLVVHDFAPPGLPTLAAPVVARGASPAPGQDEERFAEPVGWNRSPVRLSRPEAERPPAPKRPPVVLFPPEPLPFR
ncbi:MAG TPA: hypothetical protein VIL46_17365, partial [Gemmataceae bacterium]